MLTSRDITTLLTQEMRDHHHIEMNGKNSLHEGMYYLDAHFDGVFEYLLQNQVTSEFVITLQLSEYKLIQLNTIVNQLHCIEKSLLHSLEFYQRHHKTVVSIQIYLQVQICKTDCLSAFCFIDNLNKTQLSVFKLAQVKVDQTDYSALQKKCIQDLCRKMNATKESLVAHEGCTRISLS